MIASPAPASARGAGFMEARTIEAAPESQLSQKYGSRQTCRHYIMFYTEIHTIYLINKC